MLVKNDASYRDGRLCCRRGGSTDDCKVPRKAKLAARQRWFDGWYDEYFYSKYLRLTGDGSPWKPYVEN